MIPKSSVPFTRRDAALLALGAGAGGLALWLAGRSLDHDWDWGPVLGSFARFDAARGGLVPGVLLEGLRTTLALSVFSMLVALLLGTFVGVLGARAQGGPPPRLFRRLCAGSFVELLRNTPPLVLAFLFYFFVGDQLMTALGAEEAARGLPEGGRRLLATLAAPPGRLAAFASAVLTLGLYQAAYIAEIVRAGIESVERGQWEAAYALGLSPWQRLRRVVLPQALRRSVPALAGQFISTVKDSSIVSVISLPELTFQAMEIMATTQRTYEIWLTVLGCYLALCLALSLASRRLERLLSAGGRR